MKCSICYEEIKLDDKVFLNKDTSDCNAYCEKCKPDGAFESTVKKAVPALGRRMNGNPESIKEKKEEPVVEEKEVIDVEPEVITSEKNEKLKLEFEVTKQVIPVIEFGFDELEKRVDAWTEKNQKLIVTEENLKEMKTFKSEIASERIKMDAFRKGIKATYYGPVKKAEDDLKSLIIKLKEVEADIKVGLDVFVEIERDKKRIKVLKIITDFYEENEIDKEYQTIEVTDRHLLKSTTMKAIKEDIKTKALGLLELQNEAVRIENEKKAEHELDIKFIKQQIKQTNEMLEVELNEKKYLNKLDNGVDPKQIVSDIVQDGRDVVVAAEKLANHNRLEKEKEAQEKFNQDAEQQEEHGIEAPEVIIRDGERYDTNTGEQIIEPEVDVFKKDQVLDNHNKYVAKPKMYKITFAVTGTYKQLELLDNFFKSNLELEYEQKTIEEVK